MKPLHIHLRNLAQLIIMDYVLIRKGIGSALPCKQKTGLIYFLLLFKTKPGLQLSVEKKKNNSSSRMTCTEGSNKGIEAYGVKLPIL